jgi:hypothetical protein
MGLIFEGTCDTERASWAKARVSVPERFIYTSPYEAAHSISAELCSYLRVENLSILFTQLPDAHGNHLDLVSFDKALYNFLLLFGNRTIH